MLVYEKFIDPQFKVFNRGGVASQLTVKNTDQEYGQISQRSVNRNIVVFRSMQNPKNVTDGGKNEVRGSKLFDFHL
jgi:hypothetical protein